MKTIRRILCAALCIGMMLSTATLFSSCDSKEQPSQKATEPTADKVQVVRAIKAVNRGEKIIRNQLEEVLVDRELVPEGAVTSISDVVNKFYKVSVCPGDCILNDKITSENLSDSVTNDTETVDDRYVVITDYLNNGETDIAKCIQKAVDENPNKTIYIPDGTYLVARPIKTSADPAKAVSFRLSNYAHVITSQNKWEGGDAIFELGALDSDKGADYSFVGGVISGGGVTGGFCVKGGDALINNFSLKNVTVGITIKQGARADVDSGVVIGANNAENGSIGVLMEGNESTLTNMRLDVIWVGVKLTGTNNVLRNIHPLYESSGNDSLNSCGFWDDGTGNFFDLCYSDQFAIGFRMGVNTRSVFNGCFVYWFRRWDGKHHGFHADGQFNSVIRDTQVNLGNGSGNGNVDSTYLNITEPGGNGVVIYPRISSPDADKALVVEDGRVVGGSFEGSYFDYVKTDFLN